jgi:hypothetical protein
VTVARAVVHELLAPLDGREASVQRLDGTAGRHAVRGTLVVREDRHALVHTGEAAWTVTVRQAPGALLGSPSISLRPSELAGCGATPTPDGLVVDVATVQGARLRAVVAEAAVTASGDRGPGQIVPSAEAVGGGRA